MTKKKSDVPIELQRREELVDHEDMEMEQIARSLPGGVRCIRVYRMKDGSGGGRPAYKADIPPEQFNEAYVKATWGGGSYFGRWEKKDGTQLRYSFEIDGPQRPEVLEEPEGDDGPYHVPVGAVPAPASGITPFEMFKMLQEARKEAREEFQLQMNSIMKAMAPPPPQPDISEKVFSVVEKIIPLMQTGGEGNGGAWWMPLLMAFKEPISKIADTVRIAYEKGVPVGQAPTHGPVPSPSVAIPPSVQPVAEEPDMILLMMKQALPMLVNAGIKNADTLFYAEMILDQVPEGAYARLRDFLVKPDCLARIATLEPGIRFQNEWWEALRKDIVGLIDNPKSTHEPSNGELGEDL